MSFISRMFGGGGSSAIAAAVPAAIATPPPPLLSNKDVQAAGDAARLAAGNMEGRASTIATGPFGTPIGNTSVARKTLLGQ